MVRCRKSTQWSDEQGIFVWRAVGAIGSDEENLFKGQTHHFEKSAVERNEEIIGRGKRADRVRGEDKQ